MSTYYYRLKNNRRVEYATQGWFECPTRTEQRTSNKYGVADQGHAGVEIGKNHIVYNHAEERIELPNGDIKVMSSKTFQKATKGRTDMLCNKCQQPLVSLGYHAWVDHIIKPGEIIGGLVQLWLRD